MTVSCTPLASGAFGGIASVTSPIELLPVALLEYSHVDGRIQRIEDDARVMFLSKVGVDMQYRFQMPLPRHGHLFRQRGRSVKDRQT